MSNGTTPPGARGEGLQGRIKGQPGSFGPHLAFLCRFAEARDAAFDGARPLSDPREDLQRSPGTCPTPAVGISRMPRLGRQRNRQVQVETIVRLLLEHVERKKRQAVIGMLGS